MKKSVILFLSLVLMASFVEAKPQTHKVTGKRSKQSKKAQKQVYSFTYDATWFSYLNSRQQSVYLETMAKLALQIEGGKYAFNHPLINSLLPPAFAEVISNGYMRNTSFLSFFKEQDYGELKPICPAGETCDPDSGCPGDRRPCAPYLGLVPPPASSGREENKKPVLACSMDSTPDCRERGNMDLLKRTLNECNSERPKSSYCTRLSSEMEKSTAGVQAWCNSRSSTKYCRAALEALCKTSKKGCSAASAPTAAKIPKTGNCEKLKKEMINLRDKARERMATGSRSRPSGAYNNKFWRDMGKLTKRVCPDKTNAGNPKVMGVCNVSPGNDFLQRSEVKKYTKRSNNTKFGECMGKKRKEISKFDDKIKNLENEIEAMNKVDPSIGGDQTLDQNKKRAEINLKEQKDKRLPSIGEDVQECSEQIKANYHSIGEGRSIDDPEFQSVLGKLPSGSLSTDDEDLFKSVTGLSSGVFKKAFCRSSSMETFKRNLRHSIYSGSGKIKTPKIKGEDNGTTHGDRQAKRRKQAINAQLRMAKCLQNLKTVEETGCSVKDVTMGFPGHYLRKASLSNPILVKKKNNPNKCLLVLGHRKMKRQMTVKGKVVMNDGQPVYENADQLEFTGNVNREAKWDFVDLNAAASQYNVMHYVCHHDIVSTPGYRQTGGDGPEEAFETAE